MKNIHILPTDKSSILSIEDGILILHRPQWRKGTQNIYITSDNADINENDYIITKDGRLVEVSYLLSKDLEGASKIILTTDQDLIADGVQAIDDEFLEWFVKNPSCEEVKFVYEPKNFLDTRQGWEYTIISKIPKEDWLLNNPHCKQIESCSKSLSKKCICPKEEPKQETLEEFIQIQLSLGKYQDQESVIKYSIELGAKWQQKQDKNKYSKEEVLEHLNYLNMMPSSKLDLYTDNDEMITAKWFEQFKKK